MTFFEARDDSGSDKCEGLTSRKKILLIRLRRIGDVVMTTPAVTVLRRHLPQAALTYLVEEPYRRLVEGNPNLDRVIVVPPKQKFRDFVRLIRNIRKERYDAILDFHGGPRASWITFLSGAKLKIGYAIKHKSFLYDVRIPRQGKHGPVHSVENHANLVRTLGAEFDGADIPPLFLPAAKPEEIERVQAILLQNKCHSERSEESHSTSGIADEIPRQTRDDSSSRMFSFAQDDRDAYNKVFPLTKKAETGSAEREKIVVLHIGAGNKFRDWGVSNVAALINLLARTPGIKVFLIGAERDKKAVEEILRMESAAVVSLVGRLNLMEIKELIAQASLFVGPDSGPMHIAASTSTPIVAYFGPTLPAVFAPWRRDVDRTAILENNLACRPCKQRECVTNDYRCLRDITPEEVFIACRQFLEESH